MVYCGSDIGDTRTGADRMSLWMMTAGAIPQHMLERLDLFLHGAMLCVGTGLLLLIVAMIVLRVRARRADRDK